MATVITHTPLKPTLPQAVFAFILPDLKMSLGEHREVYVRKQKRGWPKKRVATNLVCLAAKLLSELANPIATKHTEGIQVFHTIRFYPCCHGPDNHSTSTSSLRQNLGSTLCPWLSTAAQVSGQNLWSGTTPCQQPLSDSCCCLTNLRSWEQFTESQVDSWTMTGEDRSF